MEMEVVVVVAGGGRDAFLVYVEMRMEIGGEDREMVVLACHKAKGKVR